MTTKQPKDMFGFDDQPMDATAISDDMLAADDRTLRLAAPLITLEHVDGFLRYQRALRERLEVSPLHAHQRDEHLAAAHSDALAASGLDAKTHSQVSSVANQFATRRGTVAMLQKKQAELRRKMAELEAAGDDPSEEQREQDQRLTTELARLESLQPMERRYGTDAIRALQAREKDLVELHAEVRRLVAK